MIVEHGFECLVSAKYRASLSIIIATERELLLTALLRTLFSAVAYPPVRFSTRERALALLCPIAALLFSCVSRVLPGTNFPCMLFASHGRAQCVLSDDIA